jgi:hypothetical protein
LAGPKKSTAENEDDRSDEAWIRTSNSDQAIRIRSLTMMMERGVALTEARLIEHEDENWTIWFRLSDRPGEYRLNMAKFDQPKTYRDVALAIAAIRKDFRFLGTIFLSTERRPEP